MGSFIDFLLTKSNNYYKISHIVILTTNWRSKWQLRESKSQLQKKSINF